MRHHVLLQRKALTKALDRSTRLNKCLMIQDPIEKLKSYPFVNIFKAGVANPANLFPLSVSKSFSQQPEWLPTSSCRGLLTVQWGMILKGQRSN